MRVCRCSADFTAAHVWVREKDVKLARFNGFQQKLIIKCDLIFNLQKKTSLKLQDLFVIAPHKKNTHLLHQKELSEDLSLKRLIYIKLESDFKDFRNSRSTN